MTKVELQDLRDRYPREDFESGVVGRYVLLLALDGIDFCTADDSLTSLRAELNRSAVSGMLFIWDLARQVVAYDPNELVKGEDDD